MVATPSIGLLIPTQGDPAFRNNWAAGIVNPNMGLIDDYTAGDVTKAVGGSSNVVLTYTDGASCEARQSYYVFTGALTGNIVVLWPSAHQFNFSVSNQTTGAFTLSLGVNNGSGLPLGTTVVVPNGGAAQTYRSDGTNVFQIGVQAISVPVGISQGGTGQITKAPAFDALSPTNTKGDIIVRSASTNVRQAVGANNTALIADSTQTNGVRFSAVPIVLATGNLALSLTPLTFALNTFTGFKTFELKISGMTGPGTVSTPSLLFSTNAGSSFLSSNYAYSQSQLSVSYVNTHSASASAIVLSSLGITGNYDMSIMLYGMNSALQGSLQATVTPRDTSQIITILSSGTNTATGVNAVRMTVGSSAVTGGTYTLIGYP